MAKIIPNPGLPQLGTDEFYQWLHDFHAAHNNGVGKCTPASDTEVIQVTDEAEIIYPVGYCVTEKGEQAVQEYRETQKVKLAPQAHELSA